MGFRSQILVLLLAPLAVAGDPSAPSQLPKFTPERESSVLRFVGEHHPELKMVLGQLENANQEQYQLAIRELSETVDKLARIKQQDKGLYALMREAWQMKSQAELLAAQLAHTEDNKEKIKEEIKDLLYRRGDLERRMVEHRRQRLLELVKATEDTLEHMKENRERMVETRLNTLTRSHRKPPANPASKTTKPTEK